MNIERQCEVALLITKQEFLKKSVNITQELKNEIKEEIVTSKEVTIDEAVKFMLMASEYVLEMYFDQGKNKS